MKRQYIETARSRILAGRADKEAADRYRQLAASGNLSPEVREDYLSRALEADRAAKEKLRSRV